LRHLLLQCHCGRLTPLRQWLEEQASGMRRMRMEELCFEWEARLRGGGKQEDAVAAFEAGEFVSVGVDLLGEDARPQIERSLEGLDLKNGVEWRCVRNRIDKVVTEQYKPYDRKRKRLFVTELPPDYSVLARVGDAMFTYTPQYVVLIRKQYDSVCVVCTETGRHIVQDGEFHCVDIERSLYAYGSQVTFISRSKLYTFCFA